MPVLLPLHLGSLHPVEQALTLLLAFGPFAVLAVVIVLRRRAERDEAADQPKNHPVDQPGGQADR